MVIFLIYLVDILFEKDINVNCIVNKIDVKQKCIYYALFKRFLCKIFVDQLFILVNGDLPRPIRSGFDLPFCCE